MWFMVCLPVIRGHCGGSVPIHMQGFPHIGADESLLIYSDFQDWKGLSLPHPSRFFLIIPDDYKFTSFPDGPSCYRLEC